jgi:hypothetical protein
VAGNVNQTLNPGDWTKAKTELLIAGFEIIYRHVPRRTSILAQTFEHNPRNTHLTTQKPFSSIKRVYLLGKDKTEYTTEKKQESERRE